MSIVNQLKEALKTSMKERQESKRDILRVALGEISRLESRSGMTDEDAQKVLRKIIQSNEETMGYMEKMAMDGCSIDMITVQKLSNENYILKSYLPQTLTRQEIKDSLMVAGAPIVQEIRNAKSVGQATGLCMKYFKTNTAVTVLGDDVKSVVEELRNEEIN